MVLVTPTPAAPPSYLAAESVSLHKRLDVVCSDGARFRANRLMLACLSRYGAALGDLPEDEVALSVDLPGAQVGLVLSLVHRGILPSAMDDAATEAFRTLGISLQDKNFEMLSGTEPGADLEAERPLRPEDLEREEEKEAETVSRPPVAKRRRTADEAAKGAVPVRVKLEVDDAEVGLKQEEAPKEAGAEDDFGGGDADLDWQPDQGGISDISLDSLNEDEEEQGDSGDEDFDVKTFESGGRAKRERQKRPRKQQQQQQKRRGRKRQAKEEDDEEVSDPDNEPATAGDCGVCQKRFKDLSRHDAATHSAAATTCDLCQQVCKSRQELQRHRKSAHPEGRPGMDSELAGDCIPCKKRFADIAKHNANNHTPEVTTCPICKKVSQERVRHSFTRNNRSNHCLGYIIFFSRQWTYSPALMKLRVMNPRAPVVRRFQNPYVPLAPKSIFPWPTYEL